MTPTPWPRAGEPASSPEGRPRAPLETWRALIGEYCCDEEWLSVFERDARLWLARHRDDEWRVTDVHADRLSVARSVDTAAVSVTRRADGRASSITIGEHSYSWRDLPAESQHQLRITAVQPIPEVLREARRADPPSESGEFSDSDLVDVGALDSTLRLDLRYASSNNFLGHPFYSAPRALLQRPVADAVVRAHRALRLEGFGLVILDAYRPWYVTRAFWDATPVEDRWIVADPARGSRHNRGAAVDVTLVDLESGALAEMPSTFDEPTPRACAFYPGGSSLQRWHRALLLRAMEAEGFTVNDYEWWHFDHRDWPRYRVENRPIES